MPIIGIALVLSLLACEKGKQLTLEHWAISDYEKPASWSKPFIVYNGQFEVRREGRKVVYTTKEGRVQLNNQWALMPDVTPGGFTVEVDEDKREITFINSAGEAATTRGVLVVRETNGKVTVHGAEESSNESGYNKKPETNALITGNNVNVRSGPSVDNQVVFQVNKGDRVMTLEKKEPTTQDKHYVLTEPYPAKMNPPIVYPKGMAMKVLSDWWDDMGGDGWFYEVEVEQDGRKKIDTLFDYLGEDIHWEPMTGTPWYKIQTTDGRTGWVYGDFVEVDE